MPAVRLQCLLLIAALAWAAPAEAAPRTYPLTVTNGVLGGSGAALLRDELRQAQFVLYGEDHGFADSPIVLRAIAREARSNGFRYLVVEAGPRSTRLVRDALARDGIAGVTSMVRDVPLGLPFLSLREDAELAQDFLGRDARGTPYLWGIDQEFIGSSLFHLRRLAEIAPNDAARNTATTLIAAERDAASRAAQDKFFLTATTPQGFDSLAASFRGQAEAQEIIASLKESAGIYQAWIGGHNYDNNTRRARLLAANFLAGYRAVAEPGPKVIFKMGLEHVALGTTTVNTVDLGTLASSIARAGDRTALRIAFLPLGGRNLTFTPKPGNPTAIKPYASVESAEFFAGIGVDAGQLAPDGWTLIPLEPIRQALDTAGIRKLTPAARFVLLGFDYVVTTPDAKPATFLY